MKRELLKRILRPVDRLGAARYPSQRGRLDNLRQEDYALVIFDALRYDYAQRILPLYLEGTIEPLWSAGHDTFEYAARCWGDARYDDTYVSGAVPISSDVPTDDPHFDRLYGGFEPDAHLRNLVDAWRDAWNSSVGAPEPEAVAEIAHRYLDRDRLVVHFFQPHAPYIGRRSLLGYTGGSDADPRDGRPTDEPIWDGVSSGSIPTEALVDAYRSNTHRAIRSALPLLRKLCQQDRPVIVMADHGELLGSYHRKLVGHPRLSFPQIRTVPWMEVAGVKELPAGRRQVDGDTAEKLRALGYA